MNPCRHDLYIDQHILARSRQQPTKSAHQSTTMAHLLDFSSPPNAPMTMAMEPFDHGLFALHDAMPGRVDLADGATPPWPRQVSLSLYNTGGPATSSSSLAMAVQQQPFQLIRSSKYLGPAKELLGEFCSLQEDLVLPAMADGTRRAPKAGKWDDVVDGSSSYSSPWGNPPLCSMELMELGRRKARLLSMVEEVDRRYRRYRERMMTVEQQFEAVAGAGAAQVYTKLALRAMSRHFRCLRDALMGQIRALRKATAERDVTGGYSDVAVGSGATKGDTPRLRVLDQCLRQRKAFQQSESCPWRPKRGLPEHAITILRYWLFEHFLHPYPNDVDKRILAHQSGLSRRQVTNWFINARVRLWKPMIEDMHNEETNQQSADQGNRNPSSRSGDKHDHKNRALPSTTTILQSHLRTRNPNTLIPSIVADGDQLFHSYDQGLHGRRGGRGEVSLTLGLQQQPFSSLMMQQQSVLMLEAEEKDAAVLPYRNLMGSQSLLHDFSG